jgi:ABC-2 type transport system permease protein
MTTIDAPPSTALTPTPKAPSRLVVLTASLRSEWIKLRTVQSTVWSLLVTIALTVGLGALFCSARVARWDRLPPAEQLRFDPTSFSLNGVFLAQLAIGVLGVLVITSEYGTGQIRATFGATPQRLVVLAAKVVVFAIVAFVVGLVASSAAFLIGQSILAGKHASASLGDPGVLRAVLGCALYLSLLGVFAIGIGTILRRTAGAIAALVTVLLILPILANFLPDPWGPDISKYLPGQAGNSMFRVVAMPDRLSPGAGLVVLTAYAIGSVVIAAVLLSRRDA